MTTATLVGTRPTHTVYALGDLQVDVDARVTRVAGARVLLTFGEFDLLLKLIADPGRAFSREELRVDLPGAEQSTPRAVDLRIVRLRKKLAAARDFAVETVPHVGYRCWVGADGDATRMVYR